MSNALEHDASTWRRLRRAAKRASEAFPVARHAGGCCGEGMCGGVFFCERCGDVVGWCLGGSHGDERDGYCDLCYCDVSCAAQACIGLKRSRRGEPRKHGRCDSCGRTDRELVAEGRAA